MDLLHIILLFAGGLLAGFINVMAGGAGFMTFPLLLAAGMTAFLAKPVSLAALSAALDAPSVTPPSALENQNSKIEPPPSSADIFARLHTPATLARARATLRAEWPRLRATAESALAADDRAALRGLAHYLQSTALLLDDATLGALCTRLTASAAPASPEDPRALLAALTAHFAAWPPP